MRRTVVAALCILGGCTKQSPQKPQETIRTSMIVDSAAIGASDDSILESSHADTIATMNGDTLIDFGGAMINDPSAHDFGIDHYAKNGRHFIRVTRMTARKPDGKPIWDIIARLPLSGLKSPEDVAIEGLCDRNGNGDPLIFGVTGESVSEFRYQAVRAWRVDPATKTVREIPANSVTCAHVIGED
jgi:hypothetical protein